MEIILLGMDSEACFFRILRIISSLSNWIQEFGNYTIKICLENCQANHLTSEEVRRHVVYFQDRLNVHPDRADYHELLARLYHQSDDKENALKHIDLALSLYEDKQSILKIEEIKSKINQ